MHALMLSPPELSLFLVLALFLGIPLWWSMRFASTYLRRPADPPLPETRLPRVAVILPLRGADPSLRDCLRGLLAQDYPHYRLRIIIDSPDDPAWRLARDVLAERPAAVDVRLAALRRPCDTCTLKISAQMQAIAELEGDVDVIALIDADALPPRDWLRTLVAPFADPRVGAVTGVRWFAPARPTWGALVRHLWNAGSQPQMVAFGLPWGGTLALRTALVPPGDLLAQWRRSFCDDSGLGELLRRRGLTLRTLPALTMVNREDVDLAGCVRFLRRQLLCPRLDLSRWPVVLAVNVGWMLALGVAAAFTVAGLIGGHPPWLTWFGGLLAVYFAALMSILPLVERRIRRIVHARGQDIPPPAPLWRLLAASLLAQAIHCYCLAAAVLARRVQWRGVDYRIDGPQRIRLVTYEPFQPRPQPGPDHSIV
jgi:Glycosyl transferase family 21